MLGLGRTVEASPRMAPGLQRLPYEMMLYVIADLTIEETFDLALCSKHFQYLVREQNLCKVVIKAKEPYSLEAQEALESGDYSRALRRIVKRRRAIAQGSPYIAGIIGLADSFDLSGGILSYVVEDGPQRWLRILDLRQNTKHEVVVDISTLISEAIPKATGCTKYTFKILNTAHGITSCLFSFAKKRTEHWLLIFIVSQHRLLGKIRLDSASRVFVRNNQDYLYFGTHSEYGADGFRKWVLQGFDVQRCELLRPKVHLSNVVGYEIGSTVCFEVIDGYFYGVSNQTAFEIEEIDWTSYYYCFRFLVEDPDPKKTQVMRKRDSWRRQHAEGPIDDRWGFLSVEKDDATGKVRIVESRKEWLAGRSGNMRTYYTTHVVFRSSGATGAGSNAVGDLSAAAAAADDDDDALPNVPLTGLIPNNGKPNFMNPKKRLPENIHPGDDGSVMFTRSKTYLRSYYHSCSTYLDLVDDPLPSNPGLQRLRVRTGARVFGKPSVSRGTRVDLCGGASTNEESEQLSQYNDIRFWPPEQVPTNSNLQADTLPRLLNPPGYLGNVTATGDERCVIYATGGELGGLKALVYVSFDPSARLAGLIPGGSVPGESTTRDFQNDTMDAAAHAIRKGKGVCRATPEVTSGEPSEGEAPCVNLPNVASPTNNWALPTHTLPAPENGRSWARIEKAFHHDISWKYTFAL